MSSSLPESASNRLTDWLRPHLKWVIVPSWLLSGVFHGLVATLIVMISQMPSCQADMAGDGGESFRDVGIVVRSTEFESDAETPQETTEDNSEVVYESPFADQQPELSNAPPVELELPQMQQVPAIVGAGKIPLPNTLANNDLLQPNTTVNPNNISGGASSPIGGGTSFMGIDDVGKRFVYIVDRSFSMDNDNALQAAKAELLASISRLNEAQQFQIIFYSDTILMLEPRDDRIPFFWGTDIQRMQVSNRLKTVFANGGTRHLPAILKGLERNPDVIYLLTDGAAESQLSRADLDHVRRRNRGGTRIHCIEFGSTERPALDGAGNFLKALAAANQGKYIYHQVTKKFRF